MFPPSIPIYSLGTSNGFVFSMAKGRNPVICGVTRLTMKSSLGQAVSAIALTIRFGVGELCFAPQGQTGATSGIAARPGLLGDIRRSMLLKEGHGADSLAWNRFSPEVPACCCQGASLSPTCLLKLSLRGRVVAMILRDIFEFRESHETLLDVPGID